MAGRRRVRGAKSAKYYYTPGQEFREVITGAEYIGPYFEFQGRFATGVDAEDPEAKLLLPYITAPEVIQYRGKYEDFNDFFRYPKPYRPIIKPKMKVVNRVYAYDTHTEKFFEVSPRSKKYYDKDKPLRKRFIVANILWSIKGVDAIDKNIDKIAESPFPGQIKDLYLNPTEFVTSDNILTSIDGVPLFATLDAALAYGESVGLEGYHTHMYRGRFGFMAGSTHSEATGIPESDGYEPSGNTGSQTTDTDTTGGFSGQGGGDTGTGTTGGYGGGGGSGGGGYG